MSWGHLLGGLVGGWLGRRTLGPTPHQVAQWGSRWPDDDGFGPPTPSGAWPAAGYYEQLADETYQQHLAEERARQLTWQPTTSCWHGNAPGYCPHGCAW